MDDRWGCVILSGGQGRRMGGVDKSGLELEGETFRERIRGQLLELGMPCYISRGCCQNKDEAEEGLPVIADAYRGEDGEGTGPMGGIRTCLEKTGLDGLFFVSCDMPLFRAEMARILLERKKPDVDAVLWRTRDKRLQPMCGFYAGSCLDALGGCMERGDYRMTHLLADIRWEAVETAEEHIPDTWFLNVNSPETFRKLEQRRTPVLAVSGRKDTGKTALLELLVGGLRRAGIRAAVIKHDGHEFQPDVPGTDSRRLKDAGAIGTVVYSAGRYCLTKDQPSMEAEDFFRFFPEADIIFLEGRKHSDYPKLEVLRKEISCHPVCRPETVLAYVWSGETAWNEERKGAAGRPVLSASQKDELLETVIGFMDACSGVREPVSHR